MNVLLTSPDLLISRKIVVAASHQARIYGFLTAATSRLQRTSGLNYLLTVPGEGGVSGREQLDKVPAGFPWLKPVAVQLFGASSTRPG